MHASFGTNGGGQMPCGRLPPRKASVQFDTCSSSQGRPHSNACKTWLTHPLSVVSLACKDFCVRSKPHRAAWHQHRWLASDKVSMMSSKLPARPQTCKCAAQPPCPRSCRLQLGLWIAPVQGMALPPQHIAPRWDARDASVPQAQWLCIQRLRALVSPRSRTPACSATCPRDSQVPVDTQVCSNRCKQHLWYLLAGPPANRRHSC
mmetsp:Transcript_43166/g.120087  ORF Transcript_43166/g.120087 Transcript_43166/m.120087 type:complete len:205 (-) Transcript_43166:519-1133(-)